MGSSAYRKYSHIKVGYFFGHTLWDSKKKMTPYQPFQQFSMRIFQDCPVSQK
tara:strand:+ start:337 stop:492 length:156 start_codon:yes stop_codon:yes gene_type:complete